MSTRSVSPLNLSTRNVVNLKAAKLCLLVLFVAGFVCFNRPVASSAKRDSMSFTVDSNRTSSSLAASPHAAQKQPPPQPRGDHAPAPKSATTSATTTADQTSVKTSDTTRPVAATHRATELVTAAKWSFRNHVLPVLTKTGCNSGACHGALAGKNGFKLTLRGYDPDTDYAVLTRQAAGRRVSLIEPAHSLLLLKPTLTIPHGGGKRFEVDSLEYKVLSEWIAAGAPAPSEDDPVIQRLEVTPDARMLRAGAEQQLTVRAKFSDGRTEDVTRWAKFSSSDDGVASVDEDGLVKVQGSGEAAISIWYLSRVASARMSVPFPHQIDEKIFAQARRNNFVDELVLQKLKTLNIAPSHTATDSEFVRRAFLDAIGTLPTTDEVKRFLADQSPNKRAILIDALLERPEFVDYWSYKWSDLLLVSSRKLQTKTLLSFNNWIRDSVRANKPWDQFARELVVSSGTSQSNGAVNYYVIHRSPIDRAENFTVAFLGIRMTCARCHNHPLEKWTQKEYYGFANLFTRVGVKAGVAPGDSTVYTMPAGDINHPRLGKPMEPRPLDGAPLTIDAAKDRREHLAEWLTSGDNPYFTRMVVNRVWKNFMGRGLVEPVDDMRATNPASNEDLMKTLVQDFVKHRFDLKHLMRTVMNSATYQLSSATNETNLKDDKFYSHFIARRLPAEVILDGLSQVTGVPTKFDGYPPGTRSLQLPDSRVDSYFLTVFGRPERLITSEAERQQDPSLTQALHIINGKTINEKLRAPDNALGGFVKQNASDQEVVEWMYLAAYSRFPTPEEKARLVAAMSKESGGDTRRQLIEDIAWAILTGREFLFNH